MDENEIRKILEEVDPEEKISQEKIEEIVSSLKNYKENPIDKKDKNVILEELLKEEIDWKKRASIAAKIISNNLE